MIGIERIGIEYVCTGNNGRSPMAEAIAKDYIRQRQREGSLDSRIQIFSSGSGLSPVTVTKGVKEVKAQRLGIIQMGLNGGVYQGKMKDLAQKVVESGLIEERIAKPKHTDSEGWSEYWSELAKNHDEIDQCFEYLVKAEGIFRDMALLGIGLFADGTYHKPTAPREDVHLILPMTERNVGHVRQIYEGSGLQPTVMALNEYAGMPGDVPDPFCKLLPAYQETRDSLLVSVPKTIYRAVRELLR